MRDIRLLAFTISVTNTSTQPNSIALMELHVDSVLAEGRKVEYILPHASDLSERIHQADLTPFDCPCALGPKASKTGWALFSESDVIQPGARPDSYRIVVTDALGKTSEVSSLIVRDLPYEEVKSEET